MIKVILLAIGWIVLASAAYAGLSAAPWVPTKPKQKRRLMKHVDLKDGDRVYDLGCGTGTLLFEAVKKNPRIQAIGYELSILPFLIAYANHLLRGRRFQNLSIRFGDLFRKPLHEADVIFVFLLSKSYKRLRQKFAMELNDNCTVVVEAWPFPGIEPIQTVREEKLLPVFIYKGSQFR